MKDSEVIYGAEISKLSNEELLSYYEKLIVSINNGWKHEGRYILKDYTSYEIKKRMCE